MSILYSGIELIMQATALAAIRISVESIAEFYNSVYNLTPLDPSVCPSIRPRQVLERSPLWGAELSSLYIIDSLCGSIAKFSR